MSDRNKKIRGCGFHHVSMKVRDLDKSIKFYTEAAEKTSNYVGKKMFLSITEDEKRHLGFVKRFSWGQDLKRTVLMDIGDGNYFEISQGDPEHIYGDGVFRHFALRVDDCSAAIEAARIAGAEVTVETRDATLNSDPPLQVRIAFFKGPDGELIELFQNDQT